MTPFNSDLDLTFERIVPVPRPLIWKAWTEPQHLMPWFCPLPWKVVECKIDLRPGGQFYTVMQSPEGQTFPGDGCYLEVVDNERLVWTNAMLPGFRPVPPAPTNGENGSTVSFLFTAVIELADHADGTLYKATVRHADAAGKSQHEAMQFEAGWAAALAQLVAYTKSM